MRLAPLWIRKIKPVYDKLAELFGIDRRSLGLFRIALALVLLTDLWIRAQDLTAHYSDFGMLPRRELLSHPAAITFSIHFLSGAWQIQAVLFGLNAVILFCLLMGYRARLAAFLAWLFLISLQARNPQVATAADNLVRILLFWALFLPLGSCFAVDHALDSKRGKNSWRLFSIPTMAILIQMFLLYHIAGLQKTGGQWKEGSAVYYALSLDRMTTPLGDWMVQWTMLSKVLTFGVFWLEILGSFLLFSPVSTGLLRFLGFVLLSFFQLGLASTLKLGIFPWTCLAGNLLFIPSGCWRWLSHFLKVKGLLELEPLKSMNLWLLSGRCALQRRPVSRHPSWFEILLAGACLTYVVTTVSSPFHKLPFYLPSFVTKIVRHLDINQSWSMYASGFKIDGWHIAEAELENGQKMDALRGGAPVDWQKPSKIRKLYKTYRQRKFFAQLRNDGRKKDRERLSAYLCREWNAHHDGNMKIKKIDLYFMRVKTTNEGKTDPEKILWLTHQCAS